MKLKIIILMLCLFFSFVSSAQAAVWLYPTGADIYVDLITYNVSRPINFTYYKVTPDNATFNFITFDVASPNNLNIQFEEIANSSSDKNGALVKFNASTVAPIVTFQLSGFKNDSDYELHVDDNFHSYLESTDSGSLSFTYNGFSKHLFAIYGIQNYTFQVRYENYTQGLVNLSRWGPHQFIVQYEDEREENWIKDRVFIHNETNFSSYDFYNGSFNLSIDKIPLWFELHWNDTDVAIINATEEFAGYDERVQNKTTTYLTLQHIPATYNAINVTCINESSGVRSYPNFGWLNDIVTIYPYTAAGFSRVFVNYSYSYGSLYGCNRVIVAEQERNVTFYIYTNKKVYGQSSSYFNNSIVRYTYDFEDKTGVFINQPEVDTYAYIYTFTPNGTRMIIHSEYWDSTDKIYPWLMYEKEYFIGVTCSDLTIDSVGVAPTSSNTNPVVIINPPEQPFYSINDLLFVRQGWMAPPNGCYVYYQDSVGGINNVQFYLYNFSNLSLAHQSSSPNMFHNFTYLTACQHVIYYWQMIINHSYFTDNQTISGIIFYFNASVDASYVDAIMNLTLGGTPFRHHDTGLEIPWVYVLIFGVFFVLLVSFSIINAYGALIISGAWLMFAGRFFENLPLVKVYHDVTLVDHTILLQSIFLIIAGVFLIIMGVLAALGGYGQK